MKTLLSLFSIMSLISLILAAVFLEKVDIRVLDPSKGKCSVKINPGPPRTVDIDVESNMEEGDLTVTFGAFALVDGQYNEVLSSEEVTLCDMPKSENMLVAFMYKELAKSGNLSNTCPIKKAFYCVHGFRIEEEELPIPLPPGDFKIELNGTFNDKGKDSPVFHSEIFFKES